MLDGSRSRGVASRPTRRGLRIAEVMLAAAQTYLASIGLEPGFGLGLLASFERLDRNAGKEHSLDLAGFSHLGLIGDDRNSVESCADGRVKAVQALSQRVLGWRYCGIARTATCQVHRSSKKDWQV